MSENELLEKLGFEYGYYLRFKKAKKHYTAQVFKGRCEMLLELIMLGGFKPSNDEHDLFNIILKDIRGF